MPRQRRRRRPSDTASAAETWPNARVEPASGGDTPGPRRPIWLPTLGVFVAFSAGLWLGGILSVTDSASAVALLGGALGLGIGGARLLGNHLRARRARMIADDRGDEGIDG